MQTKVEICGVNTSQLTVIPAAEMDKLLRCASDGDSAARETLIRGNLRLVLSVIQRFGGRGESVDDLFQVGCIGLIKAIDNFNCDLNVRFSTYAVPMIIGEIRRYLRDNSTIRVSRSMRDIAYKALQAKEAFVRENQREPTIVELAKILDMKKEDIALALDAIVEPISLFEPVFSDGGDTVCVMDQVGDHKNTDEQWLEQIALREAIDSLNKREQRIVHMRFFEGRTQMEVAEEIHISQNKRIPCYTDEVRFLRSLSAKRGTYEVTYYIAWTLL
ncbi:MAG: RNA polymerase sporulation sigma factor SigG [Clostridiaceae bacterium]|nr:RNA polymerase sporulation sigma factor SigG [Clostridiaceae bacterium]